MIQNNNIHPSTRLHDDLHVELPHVLVGVDERREEDVRGANRVSADAIAGGGGVDRRRARLLEPAHEELRDLPREDGTRHARVRRIEVERDC